ncbi:MAG: manganese-dependent inorganic pyrophosphatase [Lachnospiraceae bacterium]|nr:manganese-dependent inorganic pyrophosphatase [Lachnospiraceae bacterium]
MKGFIRKIVRMSILEKTRRMNLTVMIFALLVAVSGCGKADTKGAAGQVVSEKGKTEQGVAGQTEAEQTEAGQGEASQDTAGQGEAEQTEAGQTEAGQDNKGQNLSEGTDGNDNKKGLDDYEIDYRALYDAIDYDGPVYVIGHKSPDSDTVCSAIGFAEVLKQIGVDCEARVTAKPNNETQYILEYFKVETPEILEDAAGKNIVLVDHNMYSQAVDGVESANIIGLLDHHNLGDVQSSAPLIGHEYPLGCTATAVCVAAKELDVNISAETAGLLAGAILSDTNNLTSSTTTMIDVDILEILLDMAGIEDKDEFYMHMMEAKESYTGMTEEDILLSDYKEYDMSGTNIGIAVVEASGIKNNRQMVERMKTAMEEYMKNAEIRNIYVAVNDNVNNITELLYYGDNTDEIIKKAFSPDADGKITFDHVASRKKDIVPALTDAYK